jgi:uncharacterized protein (DUF433 family)
VSTQEKPAPLAADDPRRRWGLFNIREASKYLGARERTLTNWARGTDDAQPVVTAFKEGKEVLLPFVGFAEAYVLTALRRAGVSMQEIRPAVADLKREVGIDHALASRNLATDGIRVLYKYAGDDPDHTVVRTKQRQFRKVVEEYLRPIHYGDDGWADRITLPRYQRARVIVDPQKAFGHPLLASGRARVEDIADRFAAGESIDDLAFDFRISREEVEDVIRVETLACRAAA